VLDLCYFFSVSNLLVHVVTYKLSATFLVRLHFLFICAVLATHCNSYIIVSIHTFATVCLSVAGNNWSVSSWGATSATSVTHKKIQ